MAWEYLMTDINYIVYMLSLMRMDMDTNLHAVDASCLWVRSEVQTPTHTMFSVLYANQGA